MSEVPLYDRSGRNRARIIIHLRSSEEGNGNRSSRSRSPRMNRTPGAGRYERRRTPERRRTTERRGREDQEPPRCRGSCNQNRQQSHRGNETARHTTPREDYFDTTLNGAYLEGYNQGYAEAWNGWTYDTCYRGEADYFYYPDSDYYYPEYDYDLGFGQYY